MEWKYRSGIYFRVRLIFAIFAIQPLIRENMYTRNICHVYPRLAGTGRSPCSYRAMTLLRYFEPIDGHLPDPTGPLSADIPPPAIRQANLDVLAAEKQDANAKMRARGPYGRLTDRQRAQIGKYASGNGDAAAARKFSKELERPVNGLLISRWHTRFSPTSSLHTLLYT